MASMYMPQSVLLQKSAGNQRVQGGSKEAESYTWLFVGLLIFTAVVSIVIWFMRRKVDREMSQNSAFEQQQCPENYSADRISDEDIYDDNKRRLFEVGGYGTDIDFERPGATESIFTFSDQGRRESFVDNFIDRSYQGYSQRTSFSQVAPM